MDITHIGLCEMVSTGKVLIQMIHGHILDTGVITKSYIFKNYLKFPNNYHPGKLDELLSKEIFAYANVPYRIKSYEDIVKNPKIQSF